MKYHDFVFIDTAVSGAGSRNNVLNIADWAGLCVSSQIGLPLGHSEWYRSVFRFTPEFELYWRNNNGSVSGYRGAHIMDFLFIDIDDAADLDRSLLKTRQALGILQDYGAGSEHFSIFFSGSKGFHIYLHAGAFLPEPDPINYAIARKFCEKLFGDIVDRKNFEILRMVREAGTINSRSGRYKTELSLEQISSLAISGILEIQPSRQYPHGFFDGTCFWECGPVDRLVTLWRECSSDTEKRTYGTRVVVPSGAARPASMELSTPQCIANMLKAVNSGTLPEGFGNQVFSILAAHYRWMPQEATLGMLLGMLPGVNKNRTHKLTEQEVAASVRQVYERGYKTGCGSRDSNWGETCLFFCNEEHSWERCPKNEQGGHNRSWYRAGTARDLCIADLKSGIPPYNFGIAEWDTFLGGVGYGRPVFFEGHRGTGKTTLVKRIIRHMTEIAFQRGELVVLASPEQYIIDQARIDMRAIAGMTQKDLRNAANGNYIPKETIEWFDRYNDTLIYMDVNEFDVAAVRRNLVEIEQKLGKKIAVFCLDGIIFLQAASRERGYRADLNTVVQCIEMARKLNFIGIFVAHYGKSERTKGVALEENVSDGMAAFGTSMIPIGAHIQGGLYWKGGIVYLKMFKARDREEAEDLPDDIPLVIDRRTQRIFTLSEISQALARGETPLSYAALEKIAHILAQMNRNDNF